MLKMLILFGFIIAVNAHSNNLLKYDADIQSDVMPQELNPEFVSGKDNPLHALFPITRHRRAFTEVDQPSNATDIKRYSRLFACVVLAISAIVEITLFIWEFYTVA